MDDETKNRKHKPRKEKLEFSDKELQEEMEDEIQEIRNRNISGLEKDELINRTYEEKKKRKREKELRKDRQRGDRTATLSGLGKRVREAESVQHMDQRQEGEINDAVGHPQPQPNEGIPLNQLGQYIKPIVLTRSKLQDMLRLPRFQQLIKGCFVRCNCDKSSNSNNYMLAEIVGTVQTPEHYTVVKASTNIKIKLQLGNRDVQVLSMNVVSNQPLSSTLEIDRWFNKNRDNIPKVENLKHKREMLERGLNKEISNEEIDSNIMRNIERIIKRGKESKEDVSSYIGFLVSKNHHLEKAIKDHEYNAGSVDEPATVNQPRRRKDGQPQPQKTQLVDLNVLQKKKAEVLQYIEALKQIQRQQLERRVEKKQVNNSKKVEQIISNYEYTVRPDAIAQLVHQRLHLMGMASECQYIRERILAEHAGRTLNIEI